jgi:hypothetical protein
MHTYIHAHTQHKHMHMPTRRLRRLSKEQPRQHCKGWLSKRRLIATIQGQQGSLLLLG